MKRYVIIVIAVKPNDDKLFDVNKSNITEQTKQSSTMNFCSFAETRKRLGRLRLSTKSKDEAYKKQLACRTILENNSIFNFLFLNLNEVY